MPSLVSIIVPCYNYSLYLEKTLLSLLQQSFQEWECIIVNDGSIDNTEVVAKNFCQSDARFKYIYQENQGLSAARNAGLKAASGKYIQLLDADDFISQNKLEKQVAFMDSHPDTDISYTTAFYFHDSDPSKYYSSFSYNEDKTINFSQNTWIKEKDERGPSLIDFFVLDNIAPVNSVLIRRQVFDKVGYFNINYCSLEDWEFWARCSFHGIRFTFVNDPLTYCSIRVHNGSMTSNTHKMKFFQIKLYNDSYQRLKNSGLLELNNIADLRKQEIDRRIRGIFKEVGLSNLSFFAAVVKILGSKWFFKLYRKELKLYLKKSISRKPHQ